MLNLKVQMTSIRRAMNRAAYRAVRQIFGSSLEATPQAILDCMPEPSFAIDLDGKVIYWNVAMEQLSGIRAKEMLGKGDYEYAKVFYRVARPILIDCVGLPMDVILAQYPGVQRAGELLVTKVETESLRRGRGGVVSAMAAPLYDARGRRIGAIEQVRDETELHRAEERIRTLSLAVEQSPHGTVITDYESNIEYVNAAFEQMYGYTAEEVIGKKMHMLNSGQTPRATVESMWQSLNQGRHWKGEFINQRKDGEIRNIFCRVSPIRQADGRIKSYLAIQEDMTERKRIGQELDLHRNHLADLVVDRTAELAALTEAAEAANEAKSAFLANMSHEIRTPMNGIIGLTRIVYQQTHHQEHRKQLGRVLDTAQNMLHMINDILDISKIEANKLSLEKVNFHLAPLLSRQVELIRQAAEAKGLSLHTAIAPPLLGALLGDPLRIGQILLNFLGNAVKFTERGEVNVKALLVDSAEDSLLVRFEIHDTGIGISEAVINRLFQAFSQADVSTTRKFGGTGLGLMISRRLAEMMDGEVGVTSDEGQGSCFWFTVRLQPGKEEQISAYVHHIGSEDLALQIEHLAEKHAGARILLVEDNEMNQEIALSLLEGTGFVIDLAENGAQAVRKARDQGYDLILMDIQMPVMDGLTATKQIRRLSWHQDTPILAMTANAFEEDRKACLAAGMNGHIGKPVAPSTFYSALMTWLSARDSAVMPVEPITPPPPVEELPEPMVSVEVVADDALAPLAGLTWVSAKTGLDSLGGRVKTYYKMLRKFAVMQEADTVAMLSALQSIQTGEGRDEARRLAHSLKGVAGSLGLPELQAKAAALEIAIKDGASEAEVLAMGAELAPIRRRVAAELLKRLPEA